MTARIDGLSPYAPIDAEQVEKDKIIAFWDEYSTTGDTGEAAREVLDEIQQQVTDCLYRRPQDIPRARSLTAKALLLIAGGIEG